MIELDGYLKIELPITLGPGQSLVINNTSNIRIYDNKGRLQETIESEQALPILKQEGSHIIQIDGEFSGNSSLMLKGSIKVEGRMEIF